ncbi:MAG TPA: XrtA system polysaccharide deacetylase [Dissulfurispiraceae bacterium]|nr:XrtA system polysaccharide deacetylase [Dissulfurispiraceae bacterium]
MDHIFNAFTVDVEDYYMVSAFADVVRFEDWHNYKSRVQDNTFRILDLMYEYRVRGTFFVLGWVAERNASLIRQIQASGHEIASHGYRHRLVYDMTPEQFRDDVRLSKSILEDITGSPVLGFRAASYTIVQKTLWALDVLAEEGYRYDSSIFPIHHDRYGLPGANRFPHVIGTKSGSLREFPPSTLSLFGLNIPVCGGGYLRLLPESLIKAAIRRINKHELQPAITYIHPWETDVGQPRLNGSLRSRIRHYLNLQSTMPKITALLSEFRFKPLSHMLDGLEPLQPQILLSPEKCRQYYG